VRSASGLRPLPSLAICYGLTALFTGARPPCCRVVLALSGRSGPWRDRHFNNDPLWLFAGSAWAAGLFGRALPAAGSGSGGLLWWPCCLTALIERLWRPPGRCCLPLLLRPGCSGWGWFRPSILGDPWPAGAGVAVLRMGSFWNVRLDPGGLGEHGRRRPAAAAAMLGGRAGPASCCGLCGAGGWGQPGCWSSPLPEQQVLVAWCYRDVTSLARGGVAVGAGVGGGSNPTGRIAESGLASEPELDQQRPWAALLFVCMAAVSPLPGRWPTPGRGRRGGKAPLLGGPNLTVAMPTSRQPWSCFCPLAGGCAEPSWKTGARRSPNRIRAPCSSHWRLRGAVATAWLVWLRAVSFELRPIPVESKRAARSVVYLLQPRAGCSRTHRPTVGSRWWAGPVGHAPGNGALPLGRLAALMANSGRLQPIP